MTTHSLQLQTLEDLSPVCKKMAPLLKPGMILLLEGPIGVGKTTFVRTLLQTLGVKGKIQSPTYTLINTYHAEFTVHHMDLYRIDTENDLAHLDLDRYFEDQESILLIEWADKLGAFHPINALKLRWDYEKDNSRQVQLDTEDSSYNHLISALTK
ncbi:tRNA (adenosine(37)-N6)-threonylcarbamoyltransferase complex ATPase subunit type 1 TsaE [Candidatus Marinamargulisbacteria bacterium SCGC AG-439-L15]|nr:tRNA (adenosine(37)-N6)-threonylcarbamoyltransferase complex ATPase subunit type 1 TsaE [Candidatus Marinamargulisbacteria bacterium SCGC AG-439-L15]